MTERLTDEQIRDNGRVCGQAHWDRGKHELSPDEAKALDNWFRHGTGSYPIIKVGKQRWMWGYLSIKAPCLYDRKWEAVQAWRIMLEIYITIYGLQRGKSWASDRA